MTTLHKTLLRRAREIIGDPACWTQTTAARDQMQLPVSPRSDEARKFCVFGALAKAVDERGLSDRWLAELFQAQMLSQLIRANDSQNHAEVLTLLEQLEKEM